MTDTLPSTPATRLRQVQDNIAAAAKAARRNPADVSLIAVSKTHPAGAIEEIIALGHTQFGENRVQEAAGKWPALRAAHPGLSLHLIGGLQTNKVRDALGLFDVIHTLDRPKLAAAIARAADELGVQPACMVQVNTGEEPQKGGVLPADVDGFVAACRGEYGLNVVGLMCIPPIDDDPALHFALLGKFARRNGLAGLSMGMSGDYELAVEMGATHIRVGTAIFGPRKARG